MEDVEFVHRPSEQFVGVAVRHWRRGVYCGLDLDRVVFDLSVVYEYSFYSSTLFSVGKEIPNGWLLWVTVRGCLFLLS